jgi:hypothetical protein
LCKSKCMGRVNLYSMASEQRSILYILSSGASLRTPFSIILWVVVTSPVAVAVEPIAAGSLAQLPTGCTSLSASMASTSPNQLQSTLSQPPYHQTSQMSDLRTCFATKRSFAISCSNPRSPLT